MSHLRRSASLALAILLLPSFAFGCLWDYDTLLQERSRFPDTLEIITGKFLRHSSAGAGFQFQAPYGVDMRRLFDSVSSLSISAMRTLQFSFCNMTLWQQK